MWLAPATGVLRACLNADDLYLQPGAFAAVAGRPGLAELSYAEQKKTLEYDALGWSACRLRWGARSANHA